MIRTLAAVFLLIPPTAGAAPVNIGVASAVRGAVNATAPGAAGRVVETGKPVFAHDKVTTGPAAKLQLLLLDQTSFTIGANSEMELDEFVFDPATNAGKVSAKIAKGAFRFVTGKVARRDPANMQVETPLATIGIRGTMTAGSVGPDEVTVVLLGPGPENNADEKSGGITVRNEQGATEIDKDGWGVTVKRGGAPSDAFQLAPGQLEGILSGVGSAPKDDTTDDTAAGDSLDESSGQGTATGKDNAGDAFAALDAAQGDTSQFASQQFGAPVTTTWADVIAIPSGTGHYSGAASYYNCTGGTCGTAALGTMSFGMDINFGAKTLGGSGTSNQITLTSPSGVSGTITSQSYAALTGDAVKSLSITPLGSGDFTGTTVKLLTAGGVVAGSASIDVRVIDTSGAFPTTTFGGPVSGGLTTP